MFAFVHRSSRLMGDTLNTKAAALSAFDDIDRDLVGGAPYLLSHFDYLNTSNRPEADRARTLIDSFLSRYPEVGRAQLRARLRSVDDIGHLGAFFELALHELFIRAGCRVISIEPPVDRTRKAPDFLLETPLGARIYLEVTLPTGRSQTDVAAQQRLDPAFKTINSIPSPDFFLSLRTSGMPTAMITGTEVKARASAMAHKPRLRRGRHCMAVRYRSCPPNLVYEEHSVRFRISPVPRRRSRGSSRPKTNDW